MPHSDHIWEDVDERIKRLEEKELPKLKEELAVLEEKIFVVGADKLECLKAWEGSGVKVNFIK